MGGKKIKSELLYYTFGCLFFYKLEKNCVYTLREYVWCHGCVRVEKINKYRNDSSDGYFDECGKNIFTPCTDE